MKYFLFILNMFITQEMFAVGNYFLDLSQAKPNLMYHVPNSYNPHKTYFPVLGKCNEIELSRLEPNKVYELDIPWPYAFMSSTLKDKNIANASIEFSDLENDRKTFYHKLRIVTTKNWQKGTIISFSYTIVARSASAMDGKEFTMHVKTNRSEFSVKKNDSKHYIKDKKYKMLREQPNTYGIITSIENLIKWVDSN